MGCACSIEIDYDYEAPVGKYYEEIARSTKHVFTEEVPCEECVDGRARVGDVGVYTKYLVRSAADDSIIDTYEYACCPDCSSVLVAYFCDWPSGNMYEVLEDELSEQEHWAMTHPGEPGIVDSRLNQLTPKAKEAVIEIIENIWEELGDDEDVCS